MKKFLRYIAFFITTAYSCTSVAQLFTEDDSARRAVLELRSRIIAVNYKSEASLCARFNPNVNVGDERFGETGLNRGDTDARLAIKDLRKRVIFLEASCEITSINFMSIPSTIGPVGEDQELRRAILDLRQRIKILDEKIKNQVAKKNAPSYLLGAEQNSLPINNPGGAISSQSITTQSNQAKEKESNAGVDRIEGREITKDEPQQNASNSDLQATYSVGKRVALVLGNASYKTRPLKNSRNDADDMSRSLRNSGFEVIDVRDGSLSQMRTAVRLFGDKLLTNDVGLVYYSGHGIEVKGRNYFIPVNADIQREDEIADQGLDVALILEKMNTAQRSVNIMIVDACRDDPFGRSFRSSSRGLATMEAPRGTIIAYATSPGKVAYDGDPRERNSPYTKHLLRAMQAPNKPIEQVFKEVRRAVQDETKNQQTPWENTSLSGDFYFKVAR